MTAASAVFSLMVGREAAAAIHRHRMAILLATLILLVLAVPIAEIASGTRFIILGATVGFLLATLQQVESYPWLRLSTRLLALIWLILNLPLPWVGGWIAAAAAASLAALTLTMLWMVARQLVASHGVDSELLCSAVGAYLLLGVFWAQTYQIIAAAIPGALAEARGAELSPSALLYFSFTSLTTTGYGDITAINPVVRMWSIFEAIIGTMYNATVIARLVSLYGAPLRSDKA